MGTSLTGVKIKDSYDAIIKVSDNGALDGTLQVLTDGLGNDSALSLSTAGASVGGTLAVSGATTLSGGVSGNVAFDTNTLFVDAANNRVGVGTASPSERLEVNGNIELSTSENTIQWQSGNGIIQAPSSLYVRSTGAGSLVFQTNTTERMKIQAGGDISFRDSSANEAFYWDASAASLGIGKSSPDGLLNLKHTSSSGAVSNDASDYALILDFNGTNNDFGRHIAIRDLNGAAVASMGGIDLGGLGATGLYFATGNVNAITERMRITSGGYLKASNDGTYAAAAGANHELRNDANGNTIANITHTSASDPYGVFIGFGNAAPNNTSNYFINCNDSSGAKLYVWSNGNVVNTNNSYGAISDAKLKENVVDASPKLEDLMQVQVRNFNYIGDDKKQLGVVAQELEQVFPSMIDESPDYEEVEAPQLDENGQEVLDENGEVVMTKERVDLGTVTKSVKYSVFVPMLIKAIQELNAKVESLEAQLNA